MLYFLPSYYLRNREAGIEAHGLNPKAVDAMKVDLDTSTQTSDIIDSELLNNAADKCPMTPPHVLGI
ncbi:ArsC [Paenibacillus amylolyticus]|uniref:ArsC n=1 Tax=Paenibacillus amylolyticus TaxID=1451 RepID=A0A100VLH1_PAEAM|nr:ArsC [Paenibacillus amylolyticus]